MRGASFKVIWFAFSKKFSFRSLTTRDLQNVLIPNVANLAQGYHDNNLGINGVKVQSAVNPCMPVPTRKQECNRKNERIFGINFNHYCNYVFNNAIISGAANLMRSEEKWREWEGRGGRGRAGFAERWQRSG